MKKYVYILLVAILMASFTIAAGSNNIKIKGVIEEINSTNLTITVNGTVIQVLLGGEGEEDYTTIVEYISKEVCQEIEFDDLALYDRVNVQARYVDGILTAKTIIVHNPVTE